MKVTFEVGKLYVAVKHFGLGGLLIIKGDVVMCVRTPDKDTGLDGLLIHKQGRCNYWWSSQINERTETFLERVPLK